ncbi:MAG TPA: hypothetical protein PKM73_05720 [Verrucomicrobiota bacterium]|nr:hypothetical protein [Verrucomicrobiota bacterium]
MGYETCLHLLDVEVDPRRRDYVERLLRNPEKARNKVAREYLKLMGMSDGGYLNFRFDPEERWAYPYGINEDDPDDDGFVLAMVGKWYDAGRFAVWLCYHCAGGKLVLHSNEADGEAFGWEFEDGRIRYLELIPCSEWRQLRPSSKRAPSKRRTRSSKRSS